MYSFQNFYDPNRSFYIPQVFPCIPKTSWLYRKWKILSCFPILLSKRASICHWIVSMLLSFKHVSSESLYLYKLTAFIIVNKTDFQYGLEWISFFIINFFRFLLFRFSLYRFYFSLFNALWKIYFRFKFLNSHFRQLLGF